MIGQRKLTLDRIPINIRRAQAVYFPGWNFSNFISFQGVQARKSKKNTASYITKC